MKLAPGTRLGPYRIEAPIGAGGMGTVYRARDTRLDRTVAIKIVDGPFSERFEREAKTIASLNHPHICTVHDVGENYLVMEYVEGAPVSGPLPVNEVVRLGSQIAEALDAAHRKGITHRDLKPGNVLAAKSGVKVIDFGLAKASPVVRGEFDVTMTKPLTAEGSILGTVAYMSPEQLQGQEADARSDIFALGCVLYEMLTGKRAFDGKSAVSVMAAILEHEPMPLSEVQPTAPAWIDRVIRRCLRKDPEARWQSARDIAMELREPPTATDAPTPASNKWPWIGGTAIISALATLAVGSYLPREVPTSRPIPFEISPFGQAFAGAGGVGNYPQISPDGSRIAFSIMTNGIPRLYVRRLDSVEVQPVPKSEGASFGAFSPDSRSVAFRADGRLKKVDLQSGTVEILGEWRNTGPPFFTWSSHGILHGGAGGLNRVTASGGASEVIIPSERNGGIPATMPSFLPDGRRFVFYSRTGPSGPGVYQGSVDEAGSKSPRFLFSSESAATFAAAGKRAYLLFVRSQSLLAQPIDERSLESTGNPIPLISGFAPAGSYLPVSAAKGILVYQNLQLYTPRRLVWVGRKGEDLGQAAPPASYQSLQLSPDGNRAVVSQVVSGSSSGDIWILDLTRGTSSRLTMDGIGSRNPIWTANGQAVTFARYGLFTMPAAGGEAVEVPLPTYARPDGFPLNWSRTANTLLFSQGGRFLWTYHGDSKQIAQLFPGRTYNQTAGQFSPDGRWIAYTSDESGSRQVYVTSYPPGNLKLTITSKGGSHPRWRTDGTELYCISDRKLIATPIRRVGSQIEAGSPQELFDFPSGGDTVNLFRYDVASNGQRFLVMLDPPDARRDPIMVVLNWKPEAAGARP